MAASTSGGEATEKSIREAAVKAIAKHGFEAASLREIAKDVGIRAPSLYNYISSKEQLLYELMKDPLTSMLTEYRALVKEIDDPAERLRVFVQVHLNFHLRSRLDVFIGNMELRSLSASHYRTIGNLREEYRHDGARHDRRQTLGRPRRRVEVRDRHAAQRFRLQRIDDQNVQQHGECGRQRAGGRGIQQHTRATTARRTSTLSLSPSQSQ